MDVVADLAQTGTLRAAINTGNRATVSVQLDGTLAGPAPSLARDLATKLRLPLSLIPYPSANAIIQSLTDEAWDIAFLAADPARADILCFSIPYLTIEATFAVASDSNIWQPNDLDRVGMRIASAAGAAYQLYLERTFQYATIVPLPSPAESLTALEAGGFDAVAGIRATLDNFVADHPQFRVLADPFQSINQTVAMRRDRMHVTKIIDDLISERFLQK